jgi:predicted DNA-binding protein (MmcQ/YjbR family)
MSLSKTAERLRKVALTYPESYEESPWGERVVKVRGKIFLFCGVHAERLYLSVKLPESRREVLTEPYAEPTAYGLGKSGWVTARFARGDGVPEQRIADWIAESYRAVAPKRLLATLMPDGKTKANDKTKANGKTKAIDKPKAIDKTTSKLRATPPKKIAKRVILLSQDPLRIERATEALAQRGVTLTSTAKVDAVRARLNKLDAVIIDVGRLQDEGLALAGEIDQSDFPILLFIVGIRDAAANKRAQTLATSADLFRAPPGDPAVVDAVTATLLRYSKQ